jgi:two-component system, OmpR family, response regulator
MRILIIEDENAIAEPVKKALERRKFAVDIANDGKSGYELASVNDYDCIVLDLNLPYIDGLEIAKRLRANDIVTPILMLTARTGTENVVQGFESGTDDYLAKPFDFRELVLRIQALVKRNGKVQTEELSAHDIVLNTSSLKVFKSGVEVRLNAKEYGILEYLLRNQSKVVSQEELLQHVWNEEIDSFTQTVRTNLKTLRQKVDPTKELIKTFKGKGYVIE